MLLLNGYKKNQKTWVLGFMFNQELQLLPVMRELLGMLLWNNHFDDISGLEYSYVLLLFHSS